MVFWHTQASLTLLVHLTQHLGLLVHLLPLWGPTYCLEVIIFAAFPILLSLCRALLWLDVLYCNFCTCHGVGGPHGWAFCHMASKSLDSLLLFIALHCVLCTSTLWAKHNTCLLVASSMFPIVVTSLNISSVMSSSFNLLINYSANNLSGFLYLHSVISVHSLPIHS